uniref:Catenin alpha 2 n=1 Tax=Sus scrofa TaxID=9823 RepID=A0A8D0XIR1_PIG
PIHMTSATSPIILKWDPKSLEIRTLTVERLLEPLVTQVTTLVNTSNKGPSGKKKGRSKKAHVLAASVEQATQNFLEKGEQIAKESQDLKEELVAAVEDVRKQGRQNNILEGYVLMCKQWIFFPRKRRLLKRIEIHLSFLILLELGA